VAAAADAELKREIPVHRSKQTPAVVVDIQSITGLQTGHLLAARGIPLIGVGSDPREPFCHSRVYDRKVYTDTTAEPLIDTLVEIGRTLPAKAPLFLSADESVLLVSRHRDRLLPWYHLALPPHQTIEMLLDKIAFARFAEQHALPIPRTAIVTNDREARAVADEFRFPFLLKPAIRSEGWSEHTREKAIKVFSPQEFFDTSAKVLGWGARIFAQEWIPGPETNLFSCNTYLDGSGAPLATFVAQKIRQWPPETGRSALGVECRNDEVRDTAIRLFQTAGFRGPAYLEMKRDERDGRHWIVEPNVGRATGRSAIAEAGGVELLLTQYCDLLGLPLPADREQQYTGAKWIYLRWDLQASLVAMFRGQLTPAQWWRSVRGPKFYAAWSRNDPLPFLLDFVGPVARRLRRTRSRQAVRSAAPIRVAASEIHGENDATSHESARAEC
jgi:predicted ATP-grasp superfamily ATP-dependent carboligase